MLYYFLIIAGILIIIQKSQNKSDEILNSFNKMCSKEKRWREINNCLKSCCLIENLNFQNKLVHTYMCTHKVSDSFYLKNTLNINNQKSPAFLGVYIYIYFFFHVKTETARAY